jgi:hypothetical protein
MALNFGFDASVDNMYRAGKEYGKEQRKFRVRKLI